MHSSVMSVYLVVHQLYQSVQILIPRFSEESEDPLGYQITFNHIKVNKME